jgi:hypothetical protein
MADIDVDGMAQVGAPASPARGPVPMDAMEGHACPPPMQ